LVGRWHSPDLHRVPNAQAVARRSILTLDGRHNEEPSIAFKSLVVEGVSHDGEFRTSRKNIVMEDVDKVLSETGVFRFVRKNCVVTGANTDRPINSSGGDSALRPTRALGFVGAPCLLVTLACAKSTLLVQADRLVDHGDLDIDGVPKPVSVRSLR
jgi:hypothetical protein